MHLTELTEPLRLRHDRCDSLGVWFRSEVDLHSAATGGIGMRPGDSLLLHDQELWVLEGTWSARTDPNVPLRQRLRSATCRLPGFRGLDLQQARRKEVLWVH